MTIWDIETAKREHQFSQRLAQTLPIYLNKSKPVYDFGCGKGTYLKHLSSLGFDCTGFEGTEQILSISDYDRIKTVDLSKPMEQITPGNVICLEVAEHIMPENEDTFLKNITDACDHRLILSWAVKGQGGTGHHNEQNAEYVIPKLLRLGFKFDQLASADLRRNAGRDLWWFQQSIYYFTR